VINPTPPTSAYPAPGTPSLSTPGIPASGYEPQPGDEKLTRGEAYLELENSSLVIGEGFPLEVVAILRGTLPDPCHEVRVVFMEPTENNAINLEAYSVADTSKACITVVEPYEATIPLGSYTNGEMLVYVNGQVLGEFGIGYKPQPGDEEMTRGQVFLELDKSEISVTGSQPVQVNVILKGSLPDPCHHLRVVSTGADEQHMINLEAYSLVPSGVRCITVIKPFLAIIPLGVFPTGHYTVQVNGEYLGEFDG
jgi:hypothetical protein